MDPAWGRFEMLLPVLACLLAAGWAVYAVGAAPVARRPEATAATGRQVAGVCLAVCGLAVGYAAVTGLV